MLEVRLLGSFQLKFGKKRVDLSSRSAQSLFAFLILNAGTSYRREKLAGQLWPDSTEESARDYLRHALWRIRKALQSASSASYLHADDLTIWFDAAAHYWLDAAALLKVTEEASADELVTVLSAYSGELLPGFYDEWVVLEREHLQAIYERKMGYLLTELEQAGRWAEVLEWGERWIALGQKPESAYRALMSAHAASGNKSKVAVVYQRCVQAMQEFGFEPSAQTRELYENLKRGRETSGIDLMIDKEAPRRKASSNIPVPITSFIGREKELREIAKLLSESRLLTLTGSGGVGKTRLALRSAQDAIQHFKDGAFWVELVGLADGDLVPQEIARALGVDESPNEPMIIALTNSLKSRELLLVLDNCEHIVEAGAKYAEQLLAACPRIKILATSRERLGLFSEIPWQVPSLSEATSVRLFAERARSVQHDFSLSDFNRDSIRQVCERLDRMPLAIELAAARASILSVEDIARRLDDRFALLTAGSRTALSHQQTLRGTIAWSHDLLTPPERILFRRLALFSGGFTLEALENVCTSDGLERSISVEVLGRLVDKSLVIPEPPSKVIGSRYHMLETIRQYAQEKLVEVEDNRLLRDRHLEFFLKLAVEAEGDLRGPKQVAWFDRLEAEVDNLRAAMLWSMAEPSIPDDGLDNSRLEKGLRLAGALNNFWERSHWREALDLTHQMLARATRPTTGRAKALLTIGYLYWAASQHEDAKPYLEEASSISRQLGENTVLAWSEGHLGAVLIALGDYESAKPHLETVSEISKSLADGGKVVMSLTSAFLGDIPFAQGDEDAARTLYEESAALAKETYDINSLTYCTRRLGYLALKQGAFSIAERRFTESLRYNQEISHIQGINRCVAAVACLRAAQGKLEQATQLCGAVEGFLGSVSASLFHWDQVFFNLNVSRLQADLPEPRFKRAWMRGLKMSLQEAVEFALATA
jgi:predicted ATPase/DNA-binding SARP family transcriptional activator